jgi:hypothetical protein
LGKPLPLRNRNKHKQKTSLALTEFGWFLEAVINFRNEDYS